MAFPNMLGIVMLAAEVKKDLDNYWMRYKEGRMIDDSMPRDVQEEALNLKA